MGTIYRLLGGPGSPYSLKMRAVLRYRRLPHVWIVPRSYLGQASELSEADKRMIPVLQDPLGNYLADSTPLIRELDRRHEERRIVPDDPATALIAGLIEDFADEWLVYAMFDSRWSSEAEADFCARRQLAAWLGPMPKAQFDEHVNAFCARQMRAREIICGPETNRPVYNETMARIVDLVEALTTERGYLFGERPSNGDFGLFGPMSQMAIDPSASIAMKSRGARAFQWVQSLDDASGVDEIWRNEWPAILPDLLKLVAETHLAYLSRLAPIAEAGETETLRFSPFGLRFELEVVPKRDLKPKGLGPGYRLKSLGALKAKLRDMPAGAKERVKPLLQESGCWEALQLRPGENAEALPVR